MLRFLKSFLGALNAAPLKAIMLSGLLISISACYLMSNQPLLPKSASVEALPQNGYITIYQRLDEDPAKWGISPASYFLIPSKDSKHPGASSDHLPLREAARIDDPEYRIAHPDLDQYANIEFKKTGHRYQLGEAYLVFGLLGGSSRDYIVQINPRSPDGETQSSTYIYGIARKTGAGDFYVSLPQPGNMPIETFKELNC